MNQNPNQWESGRGKVAAGLLYATFALVAIDIAVLLIQGRNNISSGAILLLALLLGIQLFLVVFVIGTVKRSTVSVSEGEENFRRIFHVSPVAISITTLEDGRLIDANAAYWTLMGYDPATSIGRTTFDLGIWSTENERARFVSKLKKHRSLRNPAYEFKSRSGETRITLAFYELVQWENHPTILSMFYDVTEQRVAQLALQASEEKYRTFVEESIAGIWLLRFDQPIPIELPSDEQARRIVEFGRVAECNDALVQMYGYSARREMVGKLWFDSDSEQSRNEYLQMMRHFIESSYQNRNFETQEVTIDGRMVTFLSNAVGILEDSYLTGIWGTQVDITRLKRMELALSRSETRTRGLLNAIPDLIFELNREGRILQFMPSGINEPLFPPEQFLNKTIAEVLPHVADQTAFAIERALESGFVNAFEYELTQQGERRTFEARISASGPDTVLAIVRDVSMRKWAEAERDKLIEELESKNAELEQFAYTVSHDLKSPLITIRGFLGFLREDARNGNMARLDSDMERISAATDKMQTLLNDLLELSRIGRLINKPQLVPFEKIVTEAVELVHGRISQRGIAVSIAQDLPTVFVDRLRLVEVVQNLVDNAAKFMGDQPSPRIEIGQKGFHGPMPILYVRDNGIGIPAEFMDKIFGLFNKLDARSEGTGVGLALVKRIIEFHNGIIWAESRPGQGTAFYFTLPVEAVKVPQR